MTVFLERENILSPHQHGFRSGLSTITQLTEVVHDLALSINNRSQIDMILLDLSKAFDCVSHTKLIAKVEHAIGKGEVSAWITAFLTHRSQFVMFDHMPSDVVPVTSGVPQGSVLGPLLFLIFINDITNNIGCKIKLFADDCVIYKEINSHNDHLDLSDSLNTLAEWCSQWQMSINVNKSVAMTITRKKQPSHFTYIVNGTPLSMVEQQKYLGITLTSNLNWETHITNITTTALRKLFYLKRRLKIAPTNIKLLAYKTFVRPILEYANTIWFPYTATNIAKLEAVQRKAARFIHSKYRSTDSPSRLLASSGLNTLSTRAKQGRLKFLFQMLHRQYKIDITRYISYSQSRITRHQHEHTLTEYSFSNDAFRYSFFPRVIREWNELNSSLTATNSLSLFVSQLELITRDY